MLNWANQFSTFCFLDNHEYDSSLNSLECTIGVGVRSSVKAHAGSALSELEEFISNAGNWIFGHLSYDLKNEIEHTGSSNPDYIQFPDLFFFQPEILIRFDKTKMSIQSSASDGDDILEQILAASDLKQSTQHAIPISSRIERSEYISIVEKLKQHILRGDCYEINFCQEFYAEDIAIDPVHVYKQLSAISPNPFSAFYKLEDKYLLCSSPERFLKKTGSKIVSQPIKGTYGRKVDIKEDARQKKKLLDNAKERSENVMIVDLVRNDLSKICEEGTVGVDELYGIYSFPQVHQMISTVSGRLKKESSFSEIIRATFPMGSMTGAPKKKVVELIEKYEKTKRGIFSGAVGYVTPEKDFDFNVVIRSIMYNKTGRYISLQTGSGITFYSDAKKEWEECLLKAEALKRVLES